MPVPVVYVRVVGMPVDEGLVNMVVRVWLPRGIGDAMGMPMVLVVRVAVRVLEALVAVLVLVPLRQV